MDDALPASNEARIEALVARGINREALIASAQSMRVLVYMETLLGERLDEALGRFNEALADQLTAGEAIADQHEAAMREAQEAQEAEQRKLRLTGRLP